MHLQHTVIKIEFLIILKQVHRMALMCHRTQFLVTTYNSMQSRNGVITYTIFPFKADMVEMLWENCQIYLTLLYGK